MKKLLTSSVVVLACCSFLAACGGDDSASSNTTTTTHAPITKPIDPRIIQVEQLEVAAELDGIPSEAPIEATYVLNKGLASEETITFSRRLVSDEREFVVNTSTQRLVVGEKGTLCDLNNNVASNCRIYPKDSLDEMPADLSVFWQLDTSLFAEAISEIHAQIGDTNKVSRQQRLVRDETAVCFFGTSPTAVADCVSQTHGISLTGSTTKLQSFEAATIKEEVDATSFETPDAKVASENEILNATSTTVS